MLLSRVAPPSCCARACRPRSLVIRASGAAENGDGLKEGTKVKVTAEIKVYHAPKQADGLDLTGREGVVVKNVAYFKDKHLSPNLQYKVQFELDQDGGKASKFFAHLSDEELEVVA